MHYLTVKYHKDGFTMPQVQKFHGLFLDTLDGLVILVREQNNLTLGSEMVDHQAIG
jgi:hypothetical protein